MNPLEQKIQDYLDTPILEGGRNGELFKAAALSKDLENSIQETISILSSKAERDGLSAAEIRKTIRSAHDRPVEAYVPSARFEGDHKSGFLSWDDDIGGLKAPPKKKVEVYHAEIPPPCSDFRTDFHRLLKDAFEPNEIISINYDSKEDRGKHTPIGKGVTGKGIIGVSREDCLRSKIENIVKHDKGAWVRINPMDGKGIADKNVTNYRHALVESDTLDLETQLSIYKELNLPVSCLIHSGGKSIHAWVRVEAENLEVYKKRVSYLYTLLEDNGFEIDHSNKNPSRLSRLVGVMRGDSPQYLISGRSGANNWKEWVKWLETKNDELPDIESYEDLERENPPLAPELIQGILRKGHKMLISGDSKSGKSFLQINLALSLSVGIPWLGFKTLKGPVLYVNFEIDRASFYDRLKNVKKRLGIESAHNFDVWNLRGRSAGIEELAPKIIHKIKEKNYNAIILDPLYKVLGNRDENSAGDIISFFNYLDQIGLQSGCAIIVAHHFSKGAQGQKTNHDRMSGSGVFGRDPDALITLSAIQDEDNAYKMEGTLREFPPLKAKGVRFEYPIHVLEDGLEQGVIEGEKKQGLQKNKVSDMFYTLTMGETECGLPLEILAQALDESMAVVRSKIKGMSDFDSTKFSIKNGIVYAE